MLSKKEKYRKLCSYEPSIPLFSKDWWLDATCGDKWNVCLVEKNNEILASMPYILTKNRLGMLVISQPKLTQSLGPWLKSSSSKSVNKLSNEKYLLTDLINQLPKFDDFRQSWNHSFTNWLPFYWKGFSQTTRYTYIIKDLSDLEKIWAGFRNNICGDIRKAKNVYNLKVKTDIDINSFVDLNEKVFLRQGLELPYDKSLIYKIDQACKDRKARKIFIAQDDKGRNHAGVYIVWDSNSAYYLMGGSDPDIRSSGANSLCLWEAIKFSKIVTKSFDFEGSMIEPIERFMRAFGSSQTPFFEVSFTPNRFLRTAKFLKSFLN